MTFDYTFQYKLSYQEAYDTFYLLASRLNKHKRIIYTIILTSISVLSLIFYGLDTRKVYFCLLAVFSVALLFYLLYHPSLAARKGAAKVARLNGTYRIRNNQQGEIVLPSSSKEKSSDNVIILGEDKYSRVLETDSIYAIRVDSQTTLCLPKRVTNKEQQKNLHQMFLNILS